MTFSFEGIKEELKTRLSLLSNWADTLYYGVYERILDVIAYITEKLAYLSEWYYTEANWQTATQLDSLMHKVKWLCYKPHRMKGALGNLSINIESSEFSTASIYTGITVIIPRWTQFTDIQGNVFVYSTEEKIYPNGYVGNLIVPVKEGIVKEYVHIAAGDSEEKIQLFFNNIDNDEIVVEIVNANNEKIYDVGICGVDEPTGEIILVNDLENYWCQIDNAYDFQSIILTFGDGIRNKKLNAGDRVLIRYAETKGAEGNITNSNTITVIQNILYDTAGNAVTLYVTNDEEISDGADIESLEEIKINAPQLFQSGYRAGSKKDWESILNSITYINKAKVWSAYDEGDDSVINANKVYICVVTSDGTDLTEAQKTSLETILEDYKTVTEVITFRNLEKVYIMFNINATITNKPESEMDDLLYNTLNDTYGVLNTDFKTSVYESNYISLIDQLEDVLYHETEAFYLQKGVSYTETNLKLNACYQASSLDEDVTLSSDSLGIWIQRKINNEWVSGVTGNVTQIAESTTYGNAFNGMNGYVISRNSLIDYIGGTVSYTIETIAMDLPSYGVENPTSSDPTGYILSISYKTEDGNGLHKNDIRLGNSTNITDIDKDFIFTTYNYS